MVILKGTINECVAAAANNRITVVGKCTVVIGCWKCDLFDHVSEVTVLKYKNRWMIINCYWSAIHCTVRLIEYERACIICVQIYFSFNIAITYLQVGTVSIGCVKEVSVGSRNAAVFYSVHGILGNGIAIHASKHVH
jgi:hypothetical protein